ncbi:MAG: acetyl-CoA synthase subunit gamma, partial [bacterium]|nr:acetyl-CoA synthase subunit gamma [bacterium]
FGDWVADYLETPVGKIPIVKTKLTTQDKRDNVLARWSNKKRMSFSIKPGLYGVGTPVAESPVLVTANYKMSFDALRKELSGLNAWILVLDTKGINVWCAAGKRTFGTDELIARIQKVNLENLVSHKKLILPQLGAPGVSAHLVTKAVGFHVKYGPVVARDLPEYLAKGSKATPAMRKVEFPIKDRMIVVPMELMHTLKWIPHITLFFLLLNLVKGGPILSNTLLDFAVLVGAIVMGVITAPLLLPWIPGRALAFKGWV